DLALLRRRSREERASDTSWVGAEPPSAKAARGSGDPAEDPVVDPLDSVKDVEEVAAARAAAIALVAQAFAARPAETRDGPRPVAPTTANLRLAVLSSFYAYATRQDLLRGVNPTLRVEVYAGARPLASEELRAGLEAIDLGAAEGLRDCALLLVAL